MGCRDYAVVEAETLLSLLAAPQAEEQRRVLGEYLQNPFLDDDVQALALRTGLAREEVAPLLARLRQAGLLQSAGRRGHMLDVQQIGALAEGKVVALPELLAEEAEPSLQALAPLLEALPCGVALLDGEEGLVLANAAFCELLGLPREGANIAQIAIRLGCDPRLEVGEGPRSLVLEDGLDVQLRPCVFGEFAGVLAVVEAAGMAGEVARAQAQIQEDLFAQLRREVAGPAALLRAFLERPKRAQLGAARAAIERINAFLALYLLDDPVVDEPN